MSFGIYIIGYLIVIGGLIYGASLMHVPAALDRRGGAGAGGSRNCDRRQEHAPEGLGQLAMKPLFWVGLVLLILGVASLIVPIPHNQREGVNVGGVSLGVETRHDEKAPPIVSAVMILGGVGLMIAGRPKT